MKNILFPLFVVCWLFVGANYSFAQWVRTNGLESFPVNCFAKIGSNLFAGAGNAGGAFLSTNTGTTWTAVNSGFTLSPVFSVRALAVSGANLFAGTDNGVFLSTNNGASWVSIGLTNSSVYALTISGTNLFVGTSGYGVSLSTDNGTSWLGASSGLPHGSTYYTFISSLVVSGSNIFAGTNDGVFLSTNNGTSWTAVNWGLTNIGTRALAVSGTNLFGVTYDGIFRSSDNGTNWIAASPGFRTVAGYLYSVLSIAVSGSNVFAGSYGAVFLSTNNGANWSDVSAGLPGGSVFAVAIYPPYVFAGLLDGGVYRRPLSEMVASVEMLSTDLPTHFSLDQNYPNPFNPSTTISFRLPSKSSVSLKVFDALGREMATLVSEELPAGSYAQRWNAVNAPSGAYFYRLQAKQYTETKTMLLLR
jgi:hypothetical protein